MVTPQARGSDADVWSGGREREQGLGIGTVLLATACGVGLGLLTAPQPGAKTRRLFRDWIAAITEDLSEGLSDSLEDVQEATAKARKRMRSRLAQLREGAGNNWNEVADRLEQITDRLEALRPGRKASRESSGVGTALAVAGLAALAYFLTSESAAPARSRVQEAADSVRRRATDEWDRFQRGGTRGDQGETPYAGERPETTTGSISSDEAPQAS